MCLVPFLKFKKMGTIGICPPKNGAARFDSCRPCPSCHRITLAHLHANVAASPVSEICLLLPRAIRCKKGCTCVEKEMSFAISRSSSVTYLTLQARVPMAIPMLTCHQMVARIHAHARADPCGSGRDAKIAVTGGPESLHLGAGAVNSMVNFMNRPQVQAPGPEFCVTWVLVIPSQPGPSRFAT